MRVCLSRMLDNLKYQACLKDLQRMTIEKAMDEDVDTMIGYVAQALLICCWGCSGRHRDGSISAWFSISILSFLSTFRQWWISKCEFNAVLWDAMVIFLGPGGAWVDVPSGLGLEALAPGRGIT